jgi:hypothetical protein
MARLKERNKALRRELEVAQRLMTGYHAQLMTGGAAERFATARNDAYANRGGPPPIPSYAARRAFVRRPFAAPASVDPMPFRSEFSKEKHPMARMAGLRSTLRAESKRTASELAALTAERAYAETAADLDEDEFDERDASSSAALGDDGASRDVTQIARDVAGAQGDRGRAGGSYGCRQGTLRGTFSRLRGAFSFRERSRRLRLSFLRLALKRGARVGDFFRGASRPPAFGVFAFAGGRTRTRSRRKARPSRI